MRASSATSVAKKAAALVVKKAAAAVTKEAALLPAAILDALFKVVGIADWSYPSPVQWPAIDITAPLEIVIDELAISAANQFPTKTSITLLLLSSNIIQVVKEG